MLLVFFCNTFGSAAQNNRRVSGRIVDSAEVGLPGVKVIIVSNDTLVTQTDDDGYFRYSKIAGDTFALEVIYAGYENFKSSYAFPEKEKHFKLDYIRLKRSGHMLSEVVVRAKPVPVRFMMDTIEYDARAFKVFDGDNIADLLKQLPGLIVGDNYDVTADNRQMTKLRINGKDFFTNNVKDFISKLPAGIVSKIQVIDDFGDLANFTGVKTGEPIRMLNIVTKPGMNKGAFGNVSVNGGTNSMIGGHAQLNLWNDIKQSSANISANTANNGAGYSRQTGLGVSHNDNLWKNTTGGFGYNFNENVAAFSRQQVTESQNPEGKLMTDNSSNGNNASGNHNLRLNLNYNNQKYFMQVGVNGGYNYSTNENTSYVSQYGLIRQDLNNRNQIKNTTPTISGNLTLSKKVKNMKDVFSATMSFSIQGGNNNQKIQSNTLYYDKETGALKKDSVLNRYIDTKANNNNLNFGLNYSVGLKKPKDTLARQSFNFNYNGSVSSAQNNLVTRVFDETRSDTFVVDSLSSNYNTTTINQLIAISYNYNSQKMRYNLGFNTSVNSVSNKDLKLGERLFNNAINYSPSINFSRTLAAGKVFSFNYQGMSRNPTIYQLQPIRNGQNLQNVLVGNPNLKTAFGHLLYTNFNYTLKSGQSLQLGLNGGFEQNEIVEDVVLLPDTLNSYKQITRYENINGNYQVNSNYQIYIPLKQNKYSIGYSGSFGVSNRAVLYNHNKTAGKGVNFRQQVSGSLNLKKFSLRAQFSYTITGNNNTASQRYFEYQQLSIGQISSPAFFKTTTITASVQNNLHLEKFRLNTNIMYNTTHNDAVANQVIQNNGNLNINMSGQLTLLKTYFIDFGFVKRINYGYALPITNPLLINLGLGKSFLKDKALNVSLRGNDLLGQGNNITRTISGNTVIDSRSVQPTRVFSINITYNLSHFGNKNFRVDAD